jgi:hypothetical protein
MTQNHAHREISASLGGNGRDSCDAPSEKRKGNVGEFANLQIHNCIAKGD